jgi:hypothetical protein
MAPVARKTQMSKVIYGVLAKWWSGQESPAKIGGRFIDTLDSLESVSPLMNNWRVWDRATSLLTLAEARGQMAKLVADGVSRDDDKHPYPYSGYWISADGADAQPHVAARSVDVMVNAGSAWANHISLNFGGNSMEPDLALMTYPLFKGTVEVLARTWPCPWVEVYAQTPDPRPLEPAILPLNPDRYEPPRPREEYHFPWILYLSAPYAGGLKSSKDLICEPTPGGGVVLSAVTGRLDPADPEHVRRSRRLHAIIAERLPPEKPPRWSVMAVPDARLGPY